MLLIICPLVGAGVSNMLQIMIKTMDPNGEHPLLDFAPGQSEEPYCTDPYDPDPYA